MAAQGRTSRDVDVLVVGGGPAGCAAAMSLAQSGVRVALAERAPRVGFKPGEIIDPAIFPALSRLGLSDSFERLAYPQLAGNVSLWDGPAPHEAPGLLNPHGHGVLIDRSEFEAWLLAETARCGVEVALGTARVEVARVGSRWHVHSPVRSWRAGFIVEATGRSAGVVAPPERHAADELVCLLAYPRAPGELQDRRLHIEAVEDGWWYAALLPDRRLVVALVVDRATVSGMSAASRADWFWARYGQTRLLSQWAAFSTDPQVPASVRGFPAHSSLRRELRGPGWVAVGDAAASYDPLLGRGLPLALTKGIAAARLLAACTDLDVQAEKYARAEVEAFRHYLDQHSRTYGRAGQTHKSKFWLSMQRSRGVAAFASELTSS